ncbi:MAG: MFS transporter [Spirochaetes bacterium]|nr:MFS transporter [Spirochaetota bacterium]
MPNIKEKFSFKRIYYGWYILAASFIILFFNSGAQTSFGILFKPMIAEFGWSRGTLSFAFFINMIVYSVSLVVAGKLYDRFGPRMLLIISTVLISSGYILCYSISSIWEFYIYYGFFAAVGMGGTSVPLFAAIMSKWFKKWRGLIISLGLSGTCLGRFALIPVFSFFEQNYGWRASYLFIGMAMFLVNMILILFVFKNNTDNYIEQLQGNVNIKQPDKAAAPLNVAADLRLTEAMKTGSFWLFTLTMFICGSGDFLVTNHLIPFATDQGIPAGTAANMLAWNGLLALAGILVAGPVSDIIGNKIPIAFTFLLRVLSFVLILYDRSLVSCYIFALVFGFTLLVTAPLSTTLVGRIYGFTHIGLITGFINTVHFLGGGLWTYVGGLIYDRTGNYDMAFILSAVMAFIALVSTLLIVEKKAVRR